MVLFCSVILYWKNTEQKVNLKGSEGARWLLNALAYIPPVRSPLAWASHTARAWPRPRLGHLRDMGNSWWAPLLLRATQLLNSLILKIKRPPPHHPSCKLHSPSEGYMCIMSFGNFPLLLILGQSSVPCWFSHKITSEMDGALRTLNSTQQEPVQSS